MREIPGDREVRERDTRRQGGQREIPGDGEVREIPGDREVRERYQETGRSERSTSCVLQQKYRGDLNR